MLLRASALDADAAHEVLNAELRRRLVEVARRWPGVRLDDRGVHIETREASGVVEAMLDAARLVAEACDARLSRRIYR